MPGIPLILPSSRGISLSMLKLFQGANVTPSVIANIATQNAISFGVTSFSSGLSFLGLNPSNLLNPNTFVPSGSDVLTSAARNLSIQARAQQILQGLANDPIYGSYKLIGVVGSTDDLAAGIISRNTADALSQTASVRYIPVCGHPQCYGLGTTNIPFGPKAGQIVDHDVRYMVIADPSVPNQTVSFDKVKIELEKNTIDVGGDGNVDQGNSFPWAAAIAFAIFASKRIIEDNRDLAGVFTGTHIRGNIGGLNPFHSSFEKRPYFNNGIGMANFVPTEGVTNTYQPGTSSSDAWRDYAQSSGYYYWSQFPTREYYPNGRDIHVDEKIYNEEKVIDDDYFTVTQYHAFATSSSDEPSLQDVAASVGEFQRSSLIRRLYLNFSATAGYEPEKSGKKVIAPAGYWERNYYDEDYTKPSSNPYFPYGTTIEGYKVRLQFGNPNRQSPDEDILETPTVIQAYLPYSSQPPELPSYNVNPAAYYWQWVDQYPETSKVEMTEYFAQGYKLTYQPPLSNEGKLAYLGRSRKKLVYESTSSLAKDALTLIAALGGASILLSTLIGIIPDLPSQELEDSWVDLFAIQYKVPYKLYYGAWTLAGKFSLKPKTATQWNLTSQKNGAPLSYGYVNGLPFQNPRDGAWVIDPNYAIFTSFQLGSSGPASIVGNGDAYRTDRHEEYNYPSVYNLTKTPLTLPQIAPALGQLVHVYDVNAKDKVGLTQNSDSSISGIRWDNV